MFNLIRIKQPKLKKVKIRGYRSLTKKINRKIVNVSINIMFEGLKLYMKEVYSIEENLGKKRKEQFPLEKSK